MSDPASRAAVTHEATPKLDDPKNSLERVTDAKSSRTFSSTSVNYSRTRTGPVSAFAAFGLLWTLISVRALILWIFSPDFRPVSIQDDALADEISVNELLGLILFQAYGAAMAFTFVLFLSFVPWYVIRLAKQRNEPIPQEQDRNTWLNSRLMIGGVFCLFTDSYLNAYEYTFAWNAHAANFGSWGAFMPFADKNLNSNHPVGFVWAIPVYMYYCAFSGLIGAMLVRHLQSTYRRLTGIGIIATLWGFQFCLDFVMQILTLRITGAYAFAKTYGPLTLFAGSRYQYPLYCSISVATLTTIFSLVRKHAWDDLENGISIVENGYQNWPDIIQEHIRTLAVIGFCVANTLICFTIPLTYFGMIGDSHAALPSYMKP